MFRSIIYLAVILLFVALLSVESKACDRSASIVGGCASSLQGYSAAVVAPVYAAPVVAAPVYSSPFFLVDRHSFQQAQQFHHRQRFAPQRGRFVSRSSLRY